MLAALLSLSTTEAVELSQSIGASVVHHNVDEAADANEDNQDDQDQEKAEAVPTDSEIMDAFSKANDEPKKLADDTASGDMDTMPAAVEPTSMESSPDTVTWHSLTSKKGHS